jgi:Terminase large subunit, T4likevirus-type, N-terminal
MSNSHNIDLYGAQSEVWQAMLSDKNVCAVLPVGSGKSFLASLLLPIAATTPAIHKGRDILYVCPTAPMISRIIWKDLKHRCMTMWGLEDEKQINNSSKTITFPNGIRIFCLSSETGLKGINAGLIVADEAAEFTDEALQELSNRIRPQPGETEAKGRLILISTPEGKNAFYDWYQHAINHPERWIVLHKTWEQMRVQPRAWIDEQRYLLSPLKFNKDLMCDWGSVQDQFFYAWNRNMAIHDQLYDRGKELYSFHDFNKRVMCAVVAQVVGDIRSQKGKIEILKSYAIPDCGTEGIAQRIRADFPHRPIWSIMDRSGSQLNRDTTSQFGITDQTILEKYGFRIVNTAKSNPLISDTDNSSNAFIANKRLIINDQETKLLDALETYHYEDGTRKQLVKYSDAKYAHIDGLGDCIRYGIHHLFPMTHAQPILPEYIDGDHLASAEPGQDFMRDPNARSRVDGMPTIDSLIKQRFFPEQDESWM